MKRGITALPMKFAIGLPRKGNMQGTAYIRIYADGSVLLSHGATELGQGINTKMMQACESDTYHHAVHNVNQIKIPI